MCNDAALATLAVDAVVDHARMATERAGGLRAVGMSATAISHLLAFARLSYFLTSLNLKGFMSTNVIRVDTTCYPKLFVISKIFTPFEPNTRGEAGLSLFLFLAPG